MNITLEKLLSMLKEAQDNLKAFIRRYLTQEGVLDEASQLLNDDKNLYNPDGTLTDEYETLLEKMAAKLSSDKLDEMLIESASTPEEADAIRSIIGFVEDRGQLMEDYRTTISEYDGDAYEWMKDRATDGLDEDEKNHKINRINDNLESDDDIIE